MNMSLLPLRREVVWICGLAVERAVKALSLHYICITGWLSHIVLVSSRKGKWFPSYFIDGFPELQVSPDSGSV